MNIGQKSLADHPCKGMSRADRDAFEAIAINQIPRNGWRSIDRLLEAGVIERGESEKRRDALGTYEIPRFFVPLPIHMQWCDWCSRQSERSSKGGVKI